MGIYKIATFSTIVTAIIAIVMLTLDKGAVTGIPIVIFFIGLAISIRAHSLLKGLSYTILIFAAVAAAMFYPSVFTKVGSFDLKGLIVPLLMIIMFGMGSSMSFKDFVGVIKMPKGVFIGIICQFTIMPFVGYGLATISGLPPEIAAGIILVGCSPSGLASNVMSFISKSNLALSLTLTAIATLLAPLLTPMLMKLLANQLVPIHFLGMVMSILKIVIIPIILGLVFNHFFSGKFKWLDKIMPIVSMAGIAIIITIITASGRDALLTIGLTLIIVVIIHNMLGYFLGYGIGRLLGLDQKSARTIAFEVGMQNGGLASGIALEMGRVATMGLAPAVFGPMMNITGSSLATWWRGKPVDTSK
ncbi:bile acid:sodium symporter family protein [Spongiimicrobium salis]|uniref:bile acid:sodium symporter family protein n=1 Tax=Spongiimicrobium salis TaxID=1667022 RepID=UPI00374D9274